MSPHAGSGRSPCARRTGRGRRAPPSRSWPPAADRWATARCTSPPCAPSTAERRPRPIGCSRRSRPGTPMATGRCSCAFASCRRRRWPGRASRRRSRKCWSRSSAARCAPTSRPPISSPATRSSPRARERQLGPGEPIPPVKLVRRAETLLDAHRNREALDQLSRIKLPSLCRGGCTGDRTPAALLKAALSLLAPGGLPVEHQPTAEDVSRVPQEPADPVACRAGLDRGRALRKERDYGKARAALAPVVLRCADPDLRARALYLLAQLQTMAQDARVASLWEALHRTFPGSTLSDDAVFAQALARRRAGDYAGERAFLHDIVEHHPDSDLRTEAQFRLFWSHFAEGHPRQGVIFLDELAAHPDVDGAEEERARYWRARALLEPDGAESDAARAASREAARADLIWLVELRQLTYRGLLRRARAAQADPERVRALGGCEATLSAAMLGSRARLGAGALARDPHLLAAIELLRLGIRPEAARELLAVDRAPARALGLEGEEALVLLADLSARAGDLRNAHALIRTELRGLLRRTSEPLALRAAGLAYPLAFREQIAKAAQH